MEVKLTNEELIILATAVGNATTYQLRQDAIEDFGEDAASAITLGTTSVLHIKLLLAAKESGAL